MNSTITGDAETIRTLAATISRHRGDTEAWTRLAGQLKGRRTLIGYGNRREFAAARGEPYGLNYKFLYDLEHGPDWGRTGFRVERMPAVAAAYGVTVESIGWVLDGGDLAPASPAPGPAPPALAPAWSADPPPEVRMSGVLSDQAIVAAAPYATAIMTRLRDLAAGGVMKPSGSDLFLDPARPRYEAELEVALARLDGDKAARRWDDYADLTLQGRVWLIAALQADTDAAAARPDTSVGLAAGCVRYG